MHTFSHSIDYLAKDSRLAALLPLPKYESPKEKKKSKERKNNFKCYPLLTHSLTYFTGIHMLRESIRASCCFAYCCFSSYLLFLNIKHWSSTTGINWIFHSLNKILGADNKSILNDISSLKMELSKMPFKFFPFGSFY